MRTLEYTRANILIYSRIRNGHKEYARFEKVWNGVIVQRTVWKKAK